MPGRTTTSCCERCYDLETNSENSQQGLQFPLVPCSVLCSSSLISTVYGVWSATPVVCALQENCAAHKWLNTAPLPARAGLESEALAACSHTVPGDTSEPHQEQDPGMEHACLRPGTLQVQYCSRSKRRGLGAETVCKAAQHQNMVVQAGWLVRPFQIWARM